MRTSRLRALWHLGRRREVVDEPDLAISSFQSPGAIATELRHAFRAIRRNPSISLLAILMLAVGMGASTIVFSIFYTVLLRHLPYREPERLVGIMETRLDRGWTRAAFTEANFWDVRSLNRTFEEIGAYHGGEANLTGDGPAERVRFSTVSAGLFRALGISPRLGRDFSYEEGDDRAGAPVVVLSHRFWTSRFGGDSAVLGRSLRLDGRPYTVIGVLPPGDLVFSDDAFAPFVWRPTANRMSFEFLVVGRLKRGVSTEAVDADLQRVARQIEEQNPKEAKGIGFRIMPSSEWRAGETIRAAIQVLLGAVSFLLLIACLNLANLLLARGMSRRREIAVRTALGAGRAQLARFVMMESLVLSGCGALVGLGFAHAALGAIRSLEIRGFPRLEEAALNPWVLGFAAAVALLTGLLAGLAPALHLPAAGLAEALREGSRHTGSRGQSRLRATLVAGEVALSFLLLVGAGLLIRSFSEMMNVSRGFETENRLVFSVSFPAAYGWNGLGKQFLDRLFERLSSTPQVVGAGGVSHRPLEGVDPGMGIVSSSQSALSGSDIPWAAWRVVSPGYFSAIGLRLLRGRGFEPGDPSIWSDPQAPAPQRRVILGERLAKLLFPAEEPVGGRVVLWRGQSNRDAEVIGVVSDMRERGLDADPALSVYLPFAANALTGEIVVHTRGDPLDFVPEVRAIVASLDPSLPVTAARSLDEIVHRSVAPQRFNTILLGVFSGLALLLAATGVYGVLSYSMSRRTFEIGVRVALGADRRTILRMAISQGMTPVWIGLACGALGAMWLSSYFAALLFGIRPLDAVTYAAVGLILTVAALVACYIPGRRATRIDPAIALRIE